MQSKDNKIIFYKKKIVHRNLVQCQKSGKRWKSQLLTGYISVNIHRNWIGQKRQNVCKYRMQKSPFIKKKVFLLTKKLSRRNLRFTPISDTKIALSTALERAFDGLYLCKYSLELELSQKTKCVQI